MLQGNARVVITGLGILAPNGIGAGAFWKTLIEGRSGIAPVTLFDASGLSTRIAGEVKDFDPADFALAPERVDRESRNTLLAVAAASLAIDDAGLSVDSLGDRRAIPVVMGVSTSSFDIIEAAIERQTSKGLHRASHGIVSASGIQMPANTIAHLLGVASESQTIASACAAGQDAIARAAAMIRADRADIALAGGSDAPISSAPFADFCACRNMLSRANDTPTRASRPFDRDRDGGVLSEGAAVVVLENLEHALGRGAEPLAEVAGYAARLDYSANDHGSGFQDSMRLALANASCLPADIDYICAHGPSDRELDEVETRMIKQVFGVPLAYRIPVSSIKGVTGNPLAAAGPMQIVAAALALRHGLVPMTANLEHPDPQCDLDYVPGESRPMPVRTILINNHGISGGNSSMVLRRWP